MTRTPRKRKTWVVTRSDPLLPRPYSVYLTGNGLFGYRLERAARFKTERDAEQEADYYRTTYPRYEFRVERC